MIWIVLLVVLMWAGLIVAGALVVGELWRWLSVLDKRKR